MDRTRWIIFIGMAVVILGGLVLLTRQDKVDVSNADPAKAVSETETAVGDQVYGSKSSEVVLIEYGDFQCPGCEGAYPQIKAIKEDYKDQIAFIFRNFPITTSHPNALAASTAAEAAGLQGKFWEMHDKLYENQSAWGTVDASKRTNVFTGYAKDLGLDTGKFSTDLKDPKISAKIRRDQAFGRKLGVDSTPTIYLGSEKLSADETSQLIQGNGDLLRKKIDAALKKADITTPPQQ